MSRKPSSRLLHEFTVAQSIVDSIVSEAQAHHAKRVKEISIDVGQLMQIDSKILRYALSLLLTGSVLKDAKIHLKVVNVKFCCRSCGRKWLMNESRKQLSQVSDSLLVREPDSTELPLHFLPYLYPVFLHCTRCGSADICALEGQEIVIRRVMME